jgi:hypothetical protein
VQLLLDLAQVQWLLSPLDLAKETNSLAGVRSTPKAMLLLQVARGAPLQI